MKNEQRLTGALLAHALIKIHFRPRLKPRRLALRQIGFHGEICLGQIQRGFVITHTLSVFC